jgi:hypothetical protein
MASTVAAVTEQLSPRIHYSVPREPEYQTLSTRLYPGRVVVLGDDGVVADHDRLADEGLVRYDWQHYIPLIQRKPGAMRNGAPFLGMPEPLQRVRRALLREPNGEQVMAKVLALVPESGLDAIVIAGHVLRSERNGRPAVLVDTKVVASMSSRLAEDDAGLE